ncbi:hypothetical protein TSTA_113310 [Talaromyces stipitatus ATCC 10500]|uniref:Uncharacterized protein n=1 Tax=Talaromyces stipitatus (strain ATCC 10500 / CBS 375.48 / QM 6759 / NRRL 1006) TaxID=441959 RepID=B8MCX9_TALSN|nr:uncharacterized protein TSTA_113310 [Talaromyces stipitatus ATCC 10500]EED17505.1 hypothetical protein TSTA_113310 [Talaromyces stipitatus ATCC 10500]
MQTQGRCLRQQSGPFPQSPLDHLASNIPTPQRRKPLNTFEHDSLELQSFKQKVDRNLFSYNPDDSWIWEIVSAALSVTGFALLGGFLLRIQHSRYPSWNQAISPNTVLPIIITVTGGVMLVPVSSCLSQLKWNQYHKPTPLYNMQAIDQASREPWGSFQLLWRSSKNPKIESLDHGISTCYRPVYTANIGFSCAYLSSYQWIRRFKPCTVMFPRKNVTTLMLKLSLTECTVYYRKKQYSSSSLFQGKQANYSVNISNTQPLVPFNSWSSSDTVGSSVVIRFGPPNGKATLSENVSPTPFEEKNTGLTRLFYTNGTNSSLESLPNSLTDAMRENSQAFAIPREAFIDVRSVISLLALQLETLPEYDIGTSQNVDEMHQYPKEVDVRIDRHKGHLSFTEKADNKLADLILESLNDPEVMSFSRRGIANIVTLLCTSC